MFKDIIKRILPLRVINQLIYIRNNYLDGFATKSYSQEGEDVILRRIFERQPTGFYVDVGAHHPKRFSNTYFFYKRGWHGINIDALPGSMQLFNKYRQKDINLEIGIGNKEKELKYFIFNEPALNTFNESLARIRDGLRNYRIIDTLKIKVMPLKKILDSYLPEGKEIDFMDVDVEGMDFEVLQSNDWEKYRPTVLVIEILPANTIEELTNNPMYIYLREKGYSLFAKLFNSSIFVANEKLDLVRRGKVI